MKLSGWLIGVAIAGLVGFLVGRASGGVDDPTLAADLVRWKRTAQESVAGRDSTRKELDGLKAFLATIEQEAGQWRARALASEARGNAHQRLADSLLALLAVARTPRDSARILVNACTERGLECSEIRKSNGELKEAATKDSLAKDKLNQEIAVHVKQRDRDSTDLDQAGTLVKKLEKAARGCRLPLIGLPCPVPLGEYSLDDQAFRVGGGMPIKLGRFGHVMLSVTTKVGGRKP